MRGLAINIIGIMLIAITGVAILLMYISGPLSTTVNTAFCYFSNYLGISPDFCENNQGLSKTVKFDRNSEEELARYISAYSILCWKEATKPLRKGDLICYQIFIDKPVGIISEYNFTELMEAENGCDELQNSIIKDESGVEIEYSGYCGDRDEIKWDVSGNVIENQTLILIKYNTEQNQIVIKC
ncbi:MAG: hypothetical protein KAU95_03360 [Candidatus Aenigmarchaeota archaeon]|nr:hypothetical protein [Candidatus Aenigmarchaeota archaeon]